MIETLFANPALALAVLALAILLKYALKITWTVMKWVILICVAYLIINLLGVI